MRVSNRAINAPYICGDHQAGFLRLYASLLGRLLVVIMQKRSRNLYHELTCIGQLATQRFTSEGLPRLAMQTPAVQLADTKNRE